MRTCVYTTSVPVLCNLHNYVQEIEIELGNAGKLCVLPDTTLRHVCCEINFMSRYS